MDVDQDPAGQDTPPSTPFDEGSVHTMTQGQQDTGPESIRTKNYFTPLAEEQAPAEAASAAQAQADNAEADAA